MEIDDGGFLAQLPEDHRHQADHHDDGEGDDEVGAEPVFLLAFVEHHFERAQTESQQAEAGVVDLEAVFEAAAHEVERIENQEGSEGQGKGASCQTLSTPLWQVTSCSWSPMTGWPC